MTLSPGWRKIWLTTHVMSSIGWFGAVAVFLTLALVGMTSRDPQLVRAGYLAMKLTGWFVIVPSAFVSLTSGIVSSLGTKWGLFRYYWVLLKLVITSGAAFLLLLHTQVIDMLAGIAAKTAALGAYPYGMQLKMVATSGATVVMLIMLTGLAVYKPRGMTPYGQRKQDERGNGITIGERATDQGQETVQERADSPVRAAISNSHSTRAEARWILRLRTPLRTTLVPEGPARPQADVYSIAGRARLRKIQPDSSGAHRIQSTVVLLPAGTIYRGTRKHYFVGEVQSVLSAILAQAGKTGNHGGVLAQANASPFIRMA